MANKNDLWKYIHHLPANCVKQKENGDYDVAIFVPQAFSASGFAHFDCKKFNVIQAKDGTFSIGVPEDPTFHVRVAGEDGKTAYADTKFSDLINMNNQSKRSIFPLPKGCVHDREGKNGQRFYAASIPVPNEVSENGFATTLCPAYAVTDASDKVKYVRLAGIDSDVKLSVMKNGEYQDLTMKVGDLKAKFKEARDAYKQANAPKVERKGIDIEDEPSTDEPQMGD